MVELRRGAFRLDSRKDFFSERAVGRWNGLHCDVGGSPSLRLLRSCADVALRDMVSGHGGDGLTVG